MGFLHSRASKFRVWKGRDPTAKEHESKQSIRQHLEVFHFKHAGSKTENDSRCDPCLLPQNREILTSQ